MNSGLSSLHMPKRTKKSDTYTVVASTNYYSVHIWASSPAQNIIHQNSLFITLPAPMFCFSDFPWELYELHFQKASNSGTEYHRGGIFLSFLHQYDINPHSCGHITEWFQQLLTCYHKVIRQKTRTFHFLILPGHCFTFECIPYLESLT